MENGPFEAAHALNVGYHGMGNHTHAADKILTGEGITAARGDFPNTLFLLIIRPDDFRVELDVRPHIAAVCYEVHVGVGFFLVGVALSPLPLLQKFL